MLGNLLIPVVMSHLGRRISNMVTITLFILGWLFLITAKNTIFIFVARFIQGIAIGAVLILGPILIAEYTSPCNRGLFLMIMSNMSGIYVLIGHTIGTFCSWQTTSLVCMTLAIMNLPIVIFSPESPTWLADKGRYEDCKVAFRWLRGDSEEEELKSLLKSSMIINKANNERVDSQSFLEDICSKLFEFKVIITKKEFYKPIFIMFHLYTIFHWAGINVVATYSIDLFENILEKGENSTLHIAILDVQRIISNIIALYIIKKVKRRTMLVSLTCLNIFALIAVAAYAYVKLKNIFQCSLLGVALVHVHMFAISSCTVSLPFIIAGEIFPLKYKGIASGISNISYALNFSLNVKTLPYLFITIGMHGAYCLYAAIVSYCLLITFIFLPETKDRTLQEIEREFIGDDKPLTADELKSVESLMSK